MKPTVKSALPANRKGVGGTPAPFVKSSREKLNVKNVGTEGKAASAAKSSKVAVSKVASTIANKLKTGRAAIAGAKPADSKKGSSKLIAKAEPPPPPRKIQVVQLSTLKPGARGSKAVLARSGSNGTDKMQGLGMKKRRSAELTGQQLDHFRELLNQRRARLNSDLSLMQDEALKVTAQDNSSDSVADNGTDNYEQDFTLGLIESEEALAKEVDQALMRIQQGSFGVCESCQTPVPLARLEILPFARYCVECQQKREGRS